MNLFTENSLRVLLPYFISLAEIFYKVFVIVTFFTITFPTAVCFPDRPSRSLERLVLYLSINYLKMKLLSPSYVPYVNTILPKIFHLLLYACLAHLFGGEIVLHLDGNTKGSQFNSIYFTIKFVRI